MPQDAAPPINPQLKEHFLIMGRNRWNYIVIFMGIVALCACRPQDAALERALRLAKGNRPELERVLAHYEGDSLKLEAAKFLIRNMPGHYSYADTSIFEYYDALDAVALSMEGKSVFEIKDSLEAIMDKYAPLYRGKVVQDVEVMKADYLIANIDTAFAQWQYGDWATHLDFGQFCEYLLPYKVFERQHLDNWREYLEEDYGKNVEDLRRCTAYLHSAILATNHVNGNLRTFLHPYFSTHSILLPVGRLSTWQKVPVGTCADYATLSAAVFRSCGIPVALDFTPQWPFRSMGHTWDVLLANNGKNLPFSGADTDPGQPHKLDDKMAKVYRRTYAANDEIVRLWQEEKYVPPVFRSLFLKDVTSEYMDCVDVDIEVEGEDGRYVYLTVFDNVSWVPVCFARIEGGKARFKDVGRNIAYLPLCYGENGMEKPAGDPFILTSRGKVRSLPADTLHKQPMTLTRKYPVFPYVYMLAWRTVGGVFQAADNPEFRNAETFCELKDWGLEGMEVPVPDSCGAYRYWRFLQPKEYVNTAEMYFVERKSGQFIEGRVIGTEGSWENNGADKAKAFDHDLLTCFEAPCPGSYVGMDFGKPVEVSRIFYTGRGDGNTIDLGDTYELFYWGNGHWVSMGQQKAGNVRLEYEQVPSGALYLLRDLTKGKDERIFTYEEGKQVWW